MGSLPGPPRRDNRGAADCNQAGLLAYACGSSVAIVELQSMQIVHTLWGDKPDVCVTAVRWSPEGLSRDLSRQSPLRLACGDSAGRVAIWDAARGEHVTWLGLDRNGGQIVDLCWVLGRPWQLAVLQAPSSLLILDTTSGKPLWRHEASEPLTCLRCDPFDARQLCAVGSRGLLLLLTLNGTKAQDIEHTEHRVPLGDAVEVPKKVDKKDEKKDKEEAPPLNLRCMFSPGVPKLVYVMLPKEILAFDIEFSQVVASTPVPRGYAKLLDLLTVIDGELLYCVHTDGKLSAWLRKEKKQTFSMKHVENLLPSLATQTGVSIQVLAAAHAPSLHDAPGLSLGSIPPPAAEPSLNPPGTVVTSLLSITDDGRVWKWEMTAESLFTPIDTNPPANPPANQPEGPSFRAVLAGILHTLPGLTTTLSVPTPSALTPQTLPSDGFPRTAPVPLAALATSAGTLEVVDTAALAVVSSFSVHSGAVRGVRWLGNTRLVSFSSSEVKGKTPGFLNKLAVTCVRSGLNKPFRVRTTPERGSMRGLRTSPSGRYLLILFRDAPAEVWAMTRTPQMLRSLALPFTVMEWALPGPSEKAPPGSAGHSPLSSYNPSPRTSIAAAAASAASSSALELTQGGGAATPPTKEEPGESFAFALINGSLGVFELRGRRVRDFRPKWPISNFVSGDVLVTAMAYRSPYVVMGDRGGNIRWWDVTSGLSGSFPLHRGGVRRLKFAPTPNGASSEDKGKVAALFTDHSVGIFDLDSGEPFNEAFVNKAHASLPVLEIEWLPHSGDPQEPLVLAVSASDGSYRHLDVHADVLRAHPRNRKLIRPQPLKPFERFRPAPLTSPLLLAPAQALALRMLLQHGVKAEWLAAEEEAEGGDFRSLMLASQPPLSEQAVPEILLKALEPLRASGRLLDPAAAASYSRAVGRGTAARCAFAAALFGDVIEAAFWARLPDELRRVADGSAGPDAFWVRSEDARAPAEPLSRRSSSFDDPSKKVPTRSPPPLPTPSPSSGHVPPALARLSSAAWSERDALKSLAQERIAWHERLPGVEATQKRVHEFIAIGDYESAVTLLLSTPPDAPTFHNDALRAVVLAAAVSPGMHELAVKVVAANMVTMQDPLVGTHLLCAINQHVEACSQLQESGRWADAGTLAVTHLNGVDRARVLDRWATHVLYSEQSLWRALILFVAAGNLSEALAALHSARLPDTAAMFLLACHEAKAAAEGRRKRRNGLDQETGARGGIESQANNALVEAKADVGAEGPGMEIGGNSAWATEKSDSVGTEGLSLPGSLQSDEVVVVIDHYSQFQRWLAHVLGSSNLPLE